MIMIEENNAKEWVERFLNGETTNAEEEQLYRFFAEEDIPEELQQYKPMFAWYEGGMKEPLPAKAPHSAKMHRLIVRLSIAAAILLASGVGVKLYRIHQQNIEYSCYEGSYIIRNGKKITDLKVIMPELQANLKKVERQEKDIEQMEQNAEDTQLKEMEKEIMRNVSDKATQKAIKEALYE